MRISIIFFFFIFFSFNYDKTEDRGVYWYLKYLLHLFRRVAALVALLLFSPSISLQIWYFDPLNVLVAD